MASVVDTSVKHAHSTMANAMAVNGVGGSGISLLDAFLVTGWGVKAATSLVAAGGVATLAFPGPHSATVDSVILVAGSSIAALNGEQKITAVGPGIVRFATAAADGASSAGVTFKMAPAGWTKPFGNGNPTVYKSSAVDGYGMYLWVDDTNAYQMRVVAYEQMTDINTGFGPFPMPAIVAGGGLWAKSFSANATPVPWTLFADHRMFYIGIAADASRSEAFVGQIVRGFGDLIARRPGGDPYACMLNCHVDTAAVPTVSAMQGAIASGGYTGKCFLPRDYSGLGSSVAATAYPLVGGTSSMSGVDARLGDFPGPFGELVLSPKNVAMSASSAPRADLPGVYHLPHSSVFNTFKTGDTLPGTGGLAGRNLMAVNTADAVNTGSASAIGALAFDITGPWR